MKRTSSRSASPQLIARIQAALDSGLTHEQFCELIPAGRVTGGNVGRALRGSVMADRTLRSLERCCDAFEGTRTNNVTAHEQTPIAPKAEKPQVYRSRGKIDNVLQLAEELISSTIPKRLDVLYHVYQARRLLEK